METGPVLVQRHLLSRSISACCPAGASCPSAKLSPSPVDGRGQHPKPRCQGEEAHVPDSGKGLAGGGHTHMS